MATSKPRGVSWKNAEDVALCISVVTIGEDGDKAIGQEKKKLWGRIHGVYVNCKPSGGDIRSGGGCEARW